MNRGISLYLDAVRFLAAVVVLMTHFAYPELSGGIFQPWRLVGNDAVMVFFVLSGFVIAHVSSSKERTLRDYATSRLARLWSVALPAILLTVVLDQIGRTIDPVAYSSYWYKASYPFVRLFAALTFTNELWFFSIRPFSNGPYWSLGYEAWYYAIFGAMAYLSGARRTAVAALLIVIAGPKIMLLFPIWWLGVWVWRQTNTRSLELLTSLLCFFGSIAAYTVLRSSGILASLKEFTETVLGSAVVGNLHFSDEFLASYVLGPLIALNFLGAHGLSPYLDKILSPHQGAIRWAAQSTFALYLMHYPILRFVHVTLGYDAKSLWQVAGAFALVMLICLTIGPLVEQTKGRWKLMLKQVWPARQAAAN